MTPEEQQKIKTILRTVLEEGRSASRAKKVTGILTKKTKKAVFTLSSKNTRT
jgi:hypothetical protein